MKLLFKFNLIFVLVMALGVAVSGALSRAMLQQQATAEVLGSARLMMEQASAVRAYTSGHITGCCRAIKSEFLPQSVPTSLPPCAEAGGGSTRVRLKERAEPANLRDRAVAGGRQRHSFPQQRELKEFARARHPAVSRCMSRGPCRSPTAGLPCHSSVESRAHDGRQYGPANGFAGR